MNNSPAESRRDAPGDVIRSSGNWWRWGVAWLVFTVVLCIWRFEVIDSPPYWDFGQGLWYEANYLAETNFDYPRLWYEEKRHWEGGADCYRTSVLPTVVALLMRVARPPFAQIAYHVLTFACSSAILLLTFALLRPRGGTVAAVLACAALLTTPLFGVQVDMLGMEIPMTCFALLALWGVMHERFGLAAIAGTLSFLMKAAGLLVTATTCAYLVGVLLTSGREDDPRTRRRFAWGLGLNVLALLFQYALVVWGGHIENQMESTHRAGGPGLWLSTYLCPDIMLLGLAACLVLLGTIIRLYRQQDTRVYGLLQRLRQLVGSALRQEPLLIWSAVLVVGVLLAVSRIIFLPRYLILGVPFLYIGAGSVLFARKGVRRVTVCALSVITLLNLLNTQGRFFPPLEAMYANEFGAEPTLLARTGAFLERSWEYEADHRSNMDACREIERQCQDDPVFAPTPLLHYLCFPRLGYVDRPLHGYAVSDFTRSVDRFKDATIFAPLDHPRKPVFVWVGNTFSHVSVRFDLQPPSEGDDILCNDQQPSPLIVYRRTVGEEGRQPDELERWYLERMWPTAPQLSRTVYRMHYYLATDQLDRAVAEVAALTPDGETRQSREILLAGLELRQGDYSAALDRLHTYRQGGEPLEAAYQAMRLEELHAALDPLPRDDSPGTAPPEELVEQATGYWRRGYTTAASRLLERLGGGDRKLPQAQFLQGMLALESLQLDAAVTAFENTLQQAPEHMGALLCLGWLRLYRGEYAQAEAAFRSVLEQQPEHAGAKRGLGILQESTENLSQTLDTLDAVSDNGARSAVLDIIRR